VTGGPQGAPLAVCYWRRRAGLSAGSSARLCLCLSATVSTVFGCWSAGRCELRDPRTRQSPNEVRPFRLGRSQSAASLRQALQCPLADWNLAGIWRLEVARRGGGKRGRRRRRKSRSGRKKFLGRLDVSRRKIVLFARRTIGDAGGAPVRLRRQTASCNWHKWPQAPEIRT